MATDAAILSAARAAAAALADWETAKQERAKTAREDEIALAKCNAAQIRHAEAERNLLTLSRQKPAEPVKGPEPIPHYASQGYVPDGGMPSDKQPVPIRKKEKV